MKEIIRTDRAPAAVGPYSQAVKAGDTLYASGQIHLDPETGLLVEGTVADRTHRCMQNVAAVLEAAGYTLNDVVKTTVYLTDMADFAAMNAVYASYFGAEPPARSCVQVAALPKGASVEIEVIAIR